MSEQRKPLIGWTYDPEPRHGSFGTLAKHQLFDALGEAALIATAEAIGIPAPPEPRTGRLGLNEADTREMADAKPVLPAIAAGSIHSRSLNASITMCREDVAEWDAADNAEPDTLTVTLPTDVVRQAVEAWAGSPCPTWVGRVGDACRAALTEAGLA